MILVAEIARNPIAINDLPPTSTGRACPDMRSLVGGNEGIAVNHI